MSLVLATVWFAYHYWDGILGVIFNGQGTYVDFDVAMLLVGGVTVFSLQNIVATPFSTSKRALIINVAVLAAWGAYLGYGSITVSEGQGYAIFGLKLLFIAAAPILWAHRKG